MARRGILGLTLEGDDISTAFKNLYSGWRDSNSEGGETFLQLFTSFRDRKILADLDGGALKLYLYYCFAARNQTGESWYSVEKITEYFGKQQKRTIENWNKELREKQLIYRDKVDKKSHTTFLIPYSNTILDLVPPQKDPEENQTLLDHFIDKLERLKEVYGEITGVYHLFQWGVKKGDVSEDLRTHYLLIVTKRQNDVVIGHRYKLVNHRDFGVNLLKIRTTLRFQSLFTWNNNPVQGLAFKHTLRLLRGTTTNSSMKNWLELITEMIKDGERLYTLPEIEYGHLDQFQIDDPEVEEEEEEAENDE